MQNSIKKSLSIKKWQEVFWFTRPVRVLLQEEQALSVRGSSWVREGKTIVCSTTTLVLRNREKKWEAFPFVSRQWAKMLKSNLKPVWLKLVWPALETLKFQRKPRRRVSLIGNQLSLWWQQRAVRIGPMWTQLCGRKWRWQFAENYFENCAQCARSDTVTTD